MFCRSSLRLKGIRKTRLYQSVVETPFSVATVQWSQVDKRRMCPNCRAFVTTDDRVCPYCGIQLSAPAVERRAPRDLLGGLIPHAHFTTFVILLINVGLFAATELGGQYLVMAGAKSREAIFFGKQWYRLVTAGFFHGGF